MMAASARDSPKELRARVTSKRGTTERAIEIFEAHALKQGFIDGVKAASARSRELGQELSALRTPAHGAAGGNGR